MSVKALTPALPEAQRPLKRLEKGTKRPFTDVADASQEIRSVEVSPQPEAKKAKTGLKLKIKFNGAVVSGKAPVQQPHRPLLHPRPEIQAELDALGLPEAEWRKAAPAAWKALRESPAQHTGKAETTQDEGPKEQVSADSLLKTEQIPSAQRHSEAKEQLQACGQFSPAASGREPSESLKESLENFVNGVPQKQASQHQTDRPAAAEMLPLQEGRKANLGLPQPKCADAEMLAVDTPGQVTVEESDAQAKLVVHSHTEPITKSGSGKLDSADQGNQRGPHGQETKKPASRHKQDSLRMRSRPDTDQGNDRADTKHLAPAQPMAESEAAAERPVKSSNKPTTLERRSESPSSSSTTSVSSGSDSEGEHSSESRRERSRSREAGERSDSEHLRSRKRSRDRRERTRSPQRRFRDERSPNSRRDRSRSWERQSNRSYDKRDRHLESEKDRMDYARYRRRLENFRRHEREKLEEERRQRGRERGSLNRDDLRRDRRDSHSHLRRSSSLLTDDYLDHRASRRSEAQPERRRRGSQLGSPRRSSHLVRMDSNTSPAHRDTSAEVQPPLPPDDPVGIAQAPTPSIVGFADAWNLLFGAIQEEWGTEADIDELHNAATAAKHNIDNLSKATNGKHTFENLVALMRDAYLKYMQLGAIWETIARMPNPPANRNRARLADDGGMYPGTIGLMRQVASECRTCPANTEASAILRILAEKLMAIMQMRIAQVQRNKIHQDRQFLLACPGAPKVDAFGRKLPGHETPGETYQRPSPTDSNASNNTSEQAVVLPHAAKRTGPKAPGLSGRPKAPLAPPARKTNTLGVKGGKVMKPHETNKSLEAKRAKSATPTRQPLGRDDAWAVDPLNWEIPPAKFESEMRCWSVLGGVTTYTGQVRSHMPEIQKLMQLDSSDIKEAAAKLTFVDLGIGMSNVDVILKLSRDILDLVLKIQLNGTSGPQLATQ